MKNKLNNEDCQMCAAYQIEQVALLCPYHDKISMLIDQLERTIYEHEFKHPLHDQLTIK